MNPMHAKVSVYLGAKLVAEFFFDSLEEAIEFDPTSSVWDYDHAVVEEA